MAPDQLAPDQLAPGETWPEDEWDDSGYVYDPASGRAEDADGGWDPDPHDVDDADEYGSYRTGGYRYAGAGQAPELSAYEPDDAYDEPYDGGFVADSGRRSRWRRRADVEYVDEKFPTPPRRGRGLLGFLIVLCLLATGALFGVRWFQRQIDPPGPPGEVIEVIVPRGSSTSRIAKILSDNEVIGDARLFRYYAQLKGRGGFEAGKYQLAKRSSFDDALAVLVRGPELPKELRLTIPEGLRLAQVADRVAALPNRSAAKFLELAGTGTVHSQFQPVGSTNMEGVLFPDTYSVAESDDEAKILQNMVAVFDQVAADEGLADAQRLVGVTPYEALIVASLIEREAKVPQDRAPIARVIYNRLKKGMPLQIDATVIYALGGNVTRVLNKDLEVDSPYNTYKIKGLPPAPIASPGKASIAAALKPADGNMLYYVVTAEDGSHSFATTFAEHRRNIREADRKGLR